MIKASVFGLLVKTETVIFGSPTPLLFGFMKRYRLYVPLDQSTKRLMVLGCRLPDILKILRYHGVLFQSA